MDYVNYVCVKLCTIVIPAGGVGSSVMGEMPSRLYDSVCGMDCVGECFEVPLPIIRVSHMREPMQFGLREEL